MKLSNKKSLTLISMIVTFMLLLAGCGGSNTEKTKSAAPTSSGNKNGTTTLMVYMVGSDLESGYACASDDLKEMMKVGSNDKFNIIVQTGGASKWNISGISASTNQRWLVKKDKLEKIQDVGKGDMGKPDTLSDFVSWGTKSYPADKYMLVFWNHGGGSISGYGYDELTNSMLSLTDISSALKKANNKSFELIGFDACLMATLETANILQPYSKYMAASEEIEPGHGWNYTTITKAIADTPGISGNDLGKVIADGFKAQAADEETVDGITLSVLQLDKIPNVIKSLEGLSDSIKTDIPDTKKFNTIAKARGRSEGFGQSSDGSSDMIDLADLANKVSSSSDYKQKGTDLINAIKDAVVYKVAGNDKAEASGISIYFPNNGTAEEITDSLKQYSQTGFSAKYGQLITDYISKRTGKKIDVKFEDKIPTVDNGKYEITPDNLDVEKIDKIYSVLAIKSPKDSNEIVIIGMDSNVEVDKKSGKISNNFSGQWVTLNGNFVSMYLMDEQGDSSRYTIPAKLNGTKVDILVDVDYKKGSYKFIGAWKGINPKTGMADKNIIKLKEGDKILPIYKYFNKSTGKSGYFEGKEFSFSNKPKLALSKLPKGNYLYGFYMIDIYQNENLSKFSDVAIN